MMLTNDAFDGQQTKGQLPREAVFPASPWLMLTYHRGLRGWQQALLQLPQKWTGSLGCNDFVFQLFSRVLWVQLDSPETRFWPLD